MKVVEVIIDVCAPEAEIYVKLTTRTGFQILRRAHGYFRMVRRISAKYIYWNNIDGSRDESFNSITGLNGSGKSNILDSICFVLGITNMSTVRAQNLQVN